MRKEAISIIVGSDGPTSVFVAGKNRKTICKNADKECNL